MNLETLQCNNHHCDNGIDRLMVAPPNMLYESVRQSGRCLLAVQPTSSVETHFRAYYRSKNWRTPLIRASRSAAGIIGGVHACLHDCNKLQHARSPDTVAVAWLGDRAA